MTTVLPGQTLNVGAGQTSSGVIVNSGGTLNVLSGGTIISTIDSGLVNVSSGGKAVGTTVASGQTNLFLRRQGDQRDDSSGGFDIVSSGGLDTATTVQSAAKQTDFFGGTAKGATSLAVPFRLSTSLPAHCPQHDAARRPTSRRIRQRHQHCRHCRRRC